MRVRLDRWEARNRAMLVRTLLQFLAGFGFIVFGLLGLFFGMGFFFLPDKDANAWWAHRSAIFVFVFVGLVPIAIGSLFVWSSARQRTLYRRIGELAAFARVTRRDFAPGELAQVLGVTLLAAEKLIVEASTLGILEEGPSPSATTASGHPPPPPARMAGSITPLAPSGDAPLPALTRGPVVPGAILASTYRIEEPLGSGGMGQVFAARHLRTGRRYAVKTILATAQTNATAMKRFEREATAASMLRHPNVVQVHDYNVGADGSFFLVMDLLEGETLSQRIARTGPLPFADAQRFALELCAGLSAAHAQGLLHRDIKPSNVFLAKSTGSPERSVLVDFGLVKAVDEAASAMTSTGAVLGTPMYMSPEQARGEPLDARADLYSLACVVFEAVTGAPPFLDRTMAAIYMKILNEPPPRASAVAPRPVPSGLDDVIQRALAKDKNARFPDVRAFADALATVSDDAPRTQRTVA